MACRPCALVSAWARARLSSGYRMPEPVVAAVPCLLLIVVAIWGAFMKKRCPIVNPPQPAWPLAENPSLALELVDSLKTVDALLGSPSTELGRKNRESAIRFQRLDFVLIPLYVLFLAATALLLGTWKQALPAILLAATAGIFDVMEDRQIISMAQGKQ